MYVFLIFLLNSDKQGTFLEDRDVTANEERLEIVKIIVLFYVNQMNFHSQSSLRS